MTKISWADKSWNPIVGCTKISAGCANCYAEKMACRLAHMDNRNYQDVTKPNPTAQTWFDVWNSQTVFVESALTKPLHWRKPRKIFVVSMGDLFHESVPFEWIDRVFAVMALCPQHQFMCLTKRAGRMREYIIRTGKSFDLLKAACPEGRAMEFQGLPLVTWPLSNVHLGVTAENQDNVGRIADLIQTPAAKRFVSFEPLLERIQCFWGAPGFDYAFIGCESGPGARLCHLDNIRSIRDQCLAAKVKIHVKQIPLNGKCNKNFDEWPKEFQVREV